MLRNLLESNIVNENDAALIAAAMSEQSLTAAPKEYRDRLRASLFKNMLLILNM
jgi:transcriptional regulator CtsR